VSDSSKGVAFLSHVVRRLSLFEGLSENAILRISQNVVLKSIKKQESVLNKGDRGFFLCFLLSGGLQVIDSTDDGKEIGIQFLRTGDYFGELSVIDGQLRSASVIATAHSKVLTLRHAIALDLFHNEPLVVERVLKKLAGTIRANAMQRVINANPSASQRVSAMLYNLTSVAPGGLSVINELPTQQQLAIMINTSRETVSRCMASLLERGIVERDYRRLIVRRPEELNRHGAIE